MSFGFTWILCLFVLSVFAFCLFMVIHGIVKKIRWQIIAFSAGFAVFLALTFYGFLSFITAM